MAEQDPDAKELSSEDIELLQKAAREKALRRARALREKLQAKMRELLGEDKHGDGEQTPAQ